MGEKELTMMKKSGNKTTILIPMPPEHTFLNGVHQWLHAKPLDAAIGQVPVLCCPGSRHG
jgi:hypothetical protein